MDPYSFVLCKSVHHGNTRQIAERIAAVLDTTVADPDDLNESNFSPMDEAMLLGIGSGIYWGRFHKAIRSWVRRLPANAGQGQQAFVFSTSGLPFMSALYHFPLKRALRKKGFEVIGDFGCRGHDTFFLLCLIGGLNRKHPNERDLLNAERFAITMKEISDRITTTT